MRWTPPAPVNNPAPMDYTQAARAVAASLAAGDDEMAAPGALHLAIQAWRHLADGDAAWDRFGLELLDLRTRLYPDDDVAVEVDAPPHDGPELRAVLSELVEELARYHQRLAANSDLALVQRLEHDAAAHQLRRAVAVLR